MEYLKAQMGAESMYSCNKELILPLGQKHSKKQSQPVQLLGRFLYNIKKIYVESSQNKIAKTCTYM